jgi:hypothetical protein
MGEIREADRQQNRSHAIKLHTDNLATDNSCLVVFMSRLLLADLELLLTNTLLCIQNFKYLLAKPQYLKLISLLDQHEIDSDTDPTTSKYLAQIRLKVEASRPLLQTMLDRCEEIQKAFRMNSDSLDDWTFGSEVAGVSTHYMIDNDGMISLRVEGTLYVRHYRSFFQFLILV